MDAKKSLRNRGASAAALLGRGAATIVDDGDFLKPESQESIAMPAAAASARRARGAAAAAKYLKWGWAVVLFATVLAVLYLLLPSGDEDSNSITSMFLAPASSTYEGADGTIFPCSSVHPDAEFATLRAKGEDCKHEIASVACKNEAKQLYPARLQNLCPRRLDKDLKGKYLGCFSDSFDNRIFSGMVHKLKESNSAEKCLKLCGDAGYSYAGLQYTVECFCGNSDPADDRKASSEDDCDKACPGDEAQRCGGYLTMNVYQTGIFQLPPPEQETVSDNEEPPRIVYLLTVTGRSVRQVRRLVKVLYHSSHYLLIHVDSRQDFMFRELSQLERDFPANVRMVRKRFATIWGGASLLQMLLQSMKELLEDTDWHWDFVLNLSESDYPLKSAERLSEFLSDKRGKNFVKTHGRETSDFVRKQGLDRTFHECEAHMWRVGHRKLQLGIQIDGGSDWVCLHQSFVDYIVHGSGDGLINGLREYYKYALLPAESFFHTALRNSRFCSSIVNNNLHLTNWKRKQGCKCQHKKVVDWCGCSPNVFTEGDGKKINGTRKKDSFFGRKFEPLISQGVIDRVDEWMLGKDPKSLIHWDRYWENAYHHLDSSPKARPEVLTVAGALARRHLETLEKVGNLLFQRVLEVTLFNMDDVLDGIIILYEASLNKNRGHTVTIEIKVSPIAHEANYEQLTCSMGTDFDPKELIFRNKIGAIGPESEPAVMCHLSLDGEEQQDDDIVLWPEVDVLLLDPAGRVAHFAQTKFDNASSTDVAKLTILPRPLLPGTWTLALLQHQDELADPHINLSYLLTKTTFLVTPLLPESGDDLDLSRLHSGSDVNVTWARDLSHLPSVLLNTEEASLASVKDSALEKAGLSGPSLTSWIKDLTGDFYHLAESCLASGQHPSLYLPSCASTNWSSLAPDPKSSISNLDEATGRLMM